MIFNLDSHSKEIKKIKEEVAENAGSAAVNEHTLGYSVKNLLKVDAKSGTVHGVTYTVTEDGCIILNGTVAINSSFILNSEIKLKKGEKYIFSKGVTASSPTVTSTSVYNDREKSDEFSTTSGRNVFTVADDFVKLSQVRIFARKGEVYDNVKIYPMIRHASIEDDSFESYRENVAEQLANIDDRINERLGGCLFKYENGKFYIGYDDSYVEV